MFISWEPRAESGRIYTSPSGAADYFPGGPAPKNNLENPRFDPIWYMLTLCAFEPRKTILVQNMSKIFKIILETSGHRKVMFMGGEFTGTYMYVKPQEKNAPWLFEVVWFFTWL